MTDSPVRTRQSALLAMAVGIGVLFPIGERVIFASALDRAVDWSEPFVMVVNATLAAIPFALLALRSRQSMLPWLIGLAATAGLHWWWLSKGIAYQRAPDGSGVDLAGGIIMLLSPLPITLLVIAVHQWLRRRASRG